MDIEPEQIADLLCDESFLNFCFEKSQEDILFWQQWMQHNPHKNGLIQEARKMALMLNVSVSAEEKQEQWEKIQQRLEPISQTDTTKLLALNYEEKATHKRRTAWFIIPVVLLLGIGIYYLGKPTKRDTGKKTQSAITYTTYTSLAGMRKNIMLYDSTEVLLNSNSTLRVPDNYNQDDRKVLLEGDAFFKVAHNALKPFSVNTGNTITTALGTSFRVNAYSYETNTVVSLITGKVKIDISGLKKDKEAILLPGKKINFNKEDETITQSAFDTSDMMNWVNGKLIFNNNTAGEIANKLQDWYGMEVSLMPGKSTGNIHFNGEFKDKTINDVLDAISFVTGMEYKIEGNKILLSKK